ncbi:MAG: HD-GYP domain-containing protein [Marvinbryantia sp.]|uniref:HD-GYP domain-containing protein n=1 Tax=Marvinbryantia sp. TaxID=2496532 RepID=UPI0025F265E7|nr:HD domain-containing phosphohydrolase [uncultured Marvinbryantia sp.]
MEAKKYHIIQTDLQKEIAHGIRVSNLAYRVGRQLKLPEDICYQLAVAGLVHDIGKLEIMKYMYSRKEGAPLHVEELRYVRTHPALGYAILNEEGYSSEITQWVLYHHENYDGSGYPSNKSGEEIPLGARILRVCDVYTALTTTRSYREAFDSETAVHLMIDEVKNFDMKVFLAFQEVIHEEELPEEEGGSDR